MKVWRTLFTDAMEGTIYGWHTSKRAAIRTLAAFRRDRDSQGPDGVNCIDVPTTKAALVEWLNTNLHHDNG